ncbi:Glycerophosphoryl diester phosphodiesterase family protein [Apiospora saccharicola]|uniref:Glycerophosphoryl diester phosphodiesterase family protein n=1 Tax=Apiospora saccharicola TaxID=335842 RepID=A0ABR1UJX2_9PEZI
MRFGKGFRQLPIPEFESFYVDYNEKKAEIKELIIQGRDLDSRLTRPAAYLSLERDHRRAAEFRTSSLDLVREREMDMIDNFHLGAPPTTIFAQSFRQSELAFLAGGYRDLLGILHKVRWFDRVNKAVTHRLFGKLNRVGEQKARPHNTKRPDLLELYGVLGEEVTAVSRRITKLLTELDEARIDRTPDPHAASLKETLWRFGSSSDILFNLEALHQMALQGDIEKLNYLTRPESKFEFGRVKFNQMLKYLILNRLDATTIQILERSPEYAQSLNTDSFLFCLQAAVCARESDARSAASIRDDGLLHVFKRMLKLHASQNRQILQRDDYGLSGLNLLNFATAHDLTGYSEAILSLGDSVMRRDMVIKLVKLARPIDAPQPLEIMLYRRRPIFVDIINCLNKDGRGEQDDDLRRTLGGLLLVAVKMQDDEAVRCLVDAGAGISSGYALGSPINPIKENTLHIAAMHGRVDYINLLLANIDGQMQVDALNATEHRRRLTPLAIACMCGHESVVKALLLAGADLSKLDRLGWTAKELAAYRGHQTIAGLLGDWDRTIVQGGPANAIPAMAEPVAPTLKPGEQAIIVNLGSIQARLKEDPIQVGCCSSSPAAAAKDDSLYSLTISAPQGALAGKDPVSMKFELPLINDDLDTKPCVFMLKEDATPVLTFRITTRNRFDLSQEKVVGIGSAVLESIKLTAGCPRESLVRERTAAILDCDTMDVMGTVLFTFVRATPYPHLQDPLPSQTRQSSDGMMLVGHRDLQLTRDLEAVSYHDLSFSESGTDIPIHDLTLEQFRYASQVQSPHGQPASVVGNPHNSTSGSVPRPRSRSVSARDEPGASQVQDRVKYTVDFQAKGFKPNTRGEFIHDSLVTLEEILGELPEHVGLNIEFKHPRIHETITAGIAPVVIEINKFIDVSLDKIRQSAGNRPLVFSSFTPEVCILLSLKQRAYPVMFISNVGKPPPSDLDKRGASIQTAVHFARRWGLAGIVFASEPFVLCPRLVRFVKNAGLKCGTYGPQNNEPDFVKVRRSTYSAISYRNESH